MRDLTDFAELSRDSSISLADSVGSIPAEQRDAVAEYLDAGTLFVVASGPDRDVLDPASPPVCAVGYRTDGTSAWRQVLSHYVRTYGVGVPEDIVEAAVAGRRPAPLSVEELQALGVIPPEDDDPEDPAPSG